MGRGAYSHRNFADYGLSCATVSSDDELADIRSSYSLDITEIIVVLYW